MFQFAGFEIIFLLLFVWMFFNDEIEGDQMSRMEYEAYENTLKNFMGGKDYRMDSPFHGFKTMKPINITLEHMYTAVKSKDFPPGVNGTPVYLHLDVKNPLRGLIQKGWREYAFNQFVSDVIPLNRSLPDPRDPWCKDQKYSPNLPQASVIITFHNEAWSTLMRTVHSVFNRSPEYLIKEIILFDDGSERPNLYDRLKSDVKSLSKVRLVRSDNREGLIRARIAAAKLATAPVIIFLDSHCECAPGWLEPLLDRIENDSTTVVSPIVDIILANTFEYVPQTELSIGGFNWDLRFIWIDVPKEIINERNNSAAPIDTPTISGGLFAIRKRFFEKLGYYDDGFDIWGAENLELSFKTWMCGGKLEIVPCSHVGHVYRKKMPYTTPSSLRRNNIRLAEVWLDDHAKYYFERIGHNKGEYGNITNRVNLRKKLNCRSFDWYLKNVYPHLKIPDDDVATGQIINEKDGMCIEKTASELEINMLDPRCVKLKPCHKSGGSQFWAYTKEGHLKHRDFCLDSTSEMVILNICHERVMSQIWIYNNVTKALRNMYSQSCLCPKVDYLLGYTLKVKECDKSTEQKWNLENFHMERLSPHEIFTKRVTAFSKDIFYSI